MNEWISLNEWTPYPGQIVLVCDVLNIFVTLGKVIETENEKIEFDLMHIDNVEIDSQITHWMPLPKPPEE